MELELKHLAPYLPYRLKCIHISSGDIFEMSTRAVSDDYINIDKVNGNTRKPIFHPLSEFTKEQERIIHNNHCLIDSIGGKIQDQATDEIYPTMAALEMEYIKFMNRQITYHFEQHIDMFGLIPEGLAIDINTLNQ